MTDWLPDLPRNREGTIQRGLGRGLRFNGGSSAVGFVLGTHDIDVQNALARFLAAGMTAFDIGANVGFTALLAARRVAPNGRVICFEPLPENARRIAHNSSLNGFSFVEVQQIALSRSDGEAEFFLSEAPTWGRLAQTGPAPKQSGVMRVPVRSLDSLFATDALPLPHFIKMDVEGAEADVLAGGRTLLSAARPIMVIELHHTYDIVVGELEGLDYIARPLTTTGTVASTDGEFQLLAYPRERSDVVESTWKELASGKQAQE
jgi:FkbM family methyltransferase